MTFKEFKKDIDTQILKRGYDYFINGKVIALEEVDDGMWVAEVEGNETYYVTMRTDKNEISDWECDCPYDNGSVCKHIVAVFYAIEEDKKYDNQESGNVKKVKSGNNEIIEKIFKTTTREDLQKFIIKQFSADRSIKNSFIAHFAGMMDENSENKYQIIIDNLYKAALGRNKYLDYRNARKFTTSLTELSEKADEIFLKGNLKESLVICKVLIENVSGFIQEIDDSDGGISSVLDYAFETFSEITSKAPPLLKDELFKYCIYEYRKEKYHNIGYEESFLNILPSLITTEEQEKEFIDLIDREIEVEKENDISDYSIVSLIKLKADLFKKNNLNEEVNKLIKENINYPEFRNVIINESIKQKDFIKAKNLCLEGIEISEKKNHSGTSNDWRHKLLEISELEKNISEIRKWTELIFFKTGFEMKYYRKLKSTYKDDEWSNACEKIIEKIEKEAKKFGYRNNEALGLIYVEEKFTERLLELVKLNSNQIDFIDRYAKHLKNQYPDEIILIYFKAIKSHAKITNIKIYEETAEYMKKLSVIKGSEKTLRQLINYFRGIYSNRRLMMEILDKNFPGIK